MDDELEQVLGFLEALDEDFDEVDEAMTYLWEADEGDEEYLDDDDEVDFDYIPYDESMLQAEAMDDAADAAEVAMEDLYDIEPELSEDTTSSDSGNNNDTSDDDLDGDSVTFPINVDDFSDETIAAIFEEDEADLDKEMATINNWYYWPGDRWKE